jgi:hypothetical protein
MAGAATEPFPTGEPRTGAEIAANHAALAEAGERFLRRIPGPTFFAAQGDRWSPAEHTRHLEKSARALVPALRLPQIVLLLRFGPSRRGSSSFADLVERYRGRLAAGGQAGRFAPSPKPAPADVERGRDEIVARWRHEGAALRTSAARWSESALDRCRLPHPLLGKLSVREMLMFMLYHDAHHLRLLGGRLPDGGAT